MELRLSSGGPDEALLYVKNTTGDLLSINQSHFAIKIEVRRAGNAVAPSGRIVLKASMEPKCDDFAILGPGQTRTISVPISYKADELRAFTDIYKLERGALYDVEVQLEPYFKRFTEATADEILSRFKIPNYVRETLRMNTLTLQAQ